MQTGTVLPSLQPAQAIEPTKPDPHSPRARPKPSADRVARRDRQIETWGQISVAHQTSRVTHINCSTELLPYGTVVKSGEVTASVPARQRKYTAGAEFDAPLYRKFRSHEPDVRHSVFVAQQAFFVPRYSGFDPLSLLVNTRVQWAKRDRRTRHVGSRENPARCEEDWSHPMGQRGPELTLAIASCRAFCRSSFSDAGQFAASSPT
jgi:hypothetical protein